MANREIAGLSLLELLVALAVVGMTIAFVVPSFAHFTARNRLAAASNEILSALLAARTLAVSRNARVTFCAGNPDEGCHRDWARGEWISFVDRETVGEFDGGDSLHGVGTLASPNAYVMQGNGPFNNAIVFRPSGIASWPSGAFAAGRLRVCVPKAISPNATELVLIGSGRAVSQSCDLAGACPALSDENNRCR